MGYSFEVYTPNGVGSCLTEKMEERHLAHTLKRIVGSDWVGKVNRGDAFALTISGHANRAMQGQQWHDTKDSK